MQHILQLTLTVLLLQICIVSVSCDAKYVYQCTIENCIHGKCYTNNTVCVCDNGYKTFYTTNNTNAENIQHINNCNYKQKSRMTAFLLELFLGYATGVGYFYIGRISLGIAQTVFFWGTICISCCIGFIIPNDRGIQLVFIIQCCFNIGICIWWMIAFVSMITMKINDGNGIPLY